MATIQDVAKHAGVSTAAVSLVLNEPGTRRVGPEKKQRILRAVKVLSYRPNGMARALITRASRILGLVVPLRDPIFFNTFIAGVLTGIQAVLIERGYHLMIYSHSARSGRITREQLIETRFVDGVIFINTRLCLESDMEATIEELRSAAIPHVMINNYYGHQAINYVGVDDLQTGYLAARYLIRKGRSRIAFLGSAGRTPTSRVLLEGFQNGMREGNRQMPASRVAWGEFDPAATRVIAAKWLRSKRPPNAIFCTDDQMVPIVYEVARNQNLSIPQEVAVLGRGDSFLTEYLFPKLSCLRIPTVEMGRRAAGLLIDSLSHPERLPERVLLPTEMIPRDSA